MNDQEKYRELEHTADIGIFALGKTPEELFANAAWGFLDTITNASSVKAGSSRTITLQAENVEELLVSWLSELLYIYDVDRQLFSQFEFQSLTERELTVKAAGEAFDSERHPIYREVKAITYHGLEIRKDDEEGLWNAKVIFDI